MNAESKCENYELANVYKGRINSLRIKISQGVHINGIGDADIFAVCKWCGILYSSNVLRDSRPWLRLVFPKTECENESGVTNLSRNFTKI